MWENKSELSSHPIAGFVRCSAESVLTLLEVRILEMRFVRFVSPQKTYTRLTCICLFYCLKQNYTEDPESERKESKHIDHESDAKPVTVSWLSAGR